MKRIVAGDVVLPSVAVPGYPRELEAIVLTAMANDPNARFQTGQEMIEALDAFAVRAKLTGSNTAMGRFMTQLFGSKKEPWVEGPNGSDRTQISEPNGEEIDNDEKTTLIENSHQQQLQRAMTATAPGTGVAEPRSVTASDWNHDSRVGRQQSPRPGMSAPTAPMPMGAPTLNGTGPMATIPQRIETEPGSRPLVDERMGWQTNPNNISGSHLLPHGGATRLPTQYQGQPQLTKSRSWIILAILMLLGVGVGALIAMQSS
jgi:hypothetical protein